MSKRKSGGHAAESSSPPELVCILVVDAIIDEFEVEIWCQRTDGVDRVFSSSMDWLRAERPSEDTLACSVETLLFSIIARCLRYVGEPLDVRAGLFSKVHVWAIISSVCLELDEIEKENELWREAKIVTKAAQLGLAAGFTFQPRYLDRMLSRDKPHPRIAAKAKSVLLLRLQGGRRHRRSRRVRCPEKKYCCRFHRRTNLTLTSKEPCLTRTGDLVPTCQPVQIAELAKSETYNDRN